MRQVCKNGHEMTPENTRTRPVDGYTTCRACEADRARRNRREGKAKPKSPEAIARRKERDRNRARGRGKQTYTPEQAARRAEQKRKERAERAWQQAHAYYMAWYTARRYGAGKNS